MARIDMLFPLAIYLVLIASVAKGIITGDWVGLGIYVGTVAIGVGLRILVNVWPWWPRKRK
jgi:hypothetical protein